MSSLKCCHCGGHNHFTEDDYDDDKCAGCSKNTKDTVFIHGYEGCLVFCYHCAKKYLEKEKGLKCPYCQKSIKRLMKIQIISLSKSCECHWC